MNELLLCVKQFLEAHHDKKSPLLLAYSGGPDSTALLHLLLDCQKELTFDFHIAHVDHGWREESKVEAEALKEKAKKLNIPFHLKRIEKRIEKNWEDEGRNERLQFFKTLVAQYGYQAVLQAHQKDDLVETVLKRVFEGANLSNLRGVESIIKINGIMIFRPLLSILKSDLLLYLQAQNIQWIEDKTNSDPRFLRSRLRHQLLPLLTDYFGKEIHTNLVELSKRSKELKEVLDEKCIPLLDKVHKGAMGAYIDLNELIDLDKVARKHFLGLLAKDQDIELSRTVVEQICKWIEEKEPAKKILLKDKIVVIDRQNIFFLKNLPKSISQTIELKEGEQKIGDFMVELSECDQQTKWGDWQDLFKGKSQVFVPKDNYSLSFAEFGEKYGANPIKKWWIENQVPSFLRFGIPIIRKNEEVIADFSSGKGKIPFTNGNKLYRITVVIK